jgi:hypothetical protein
MAKAARRPKFAARLATVMLGALLGSTVMIGSASSMPANALASAVLKQSVEGLQHVGWVCGPYRCWWRPFAGGPYWAPYRPWGPGYYCNPYYNRYCYPYYGYRW